MLKECIETGKTVDKAIESACLKLGLSTDQVSFEIIDMPRRSMFGFKVIPAKVRVYAEVEDEPVQKPGEPSFEKPVRAPEKKEKAPKENSRSKNKDKETYSEPQKPAAPCAQPEAAKPAAEQQVKELTPEDLALIEQKKNIAIEYLSRVLTDIGLTSCTIDAESTPDGIVLTLSGEDMGVIIGRRGETLDSLQYLVGLVANRLGGSYLRITIDSGNFREKREKTLQALARRLAGNVLKTGKPITLEPMNPYERRIIHAVVSAMEGATSTSIGEEPNRRVVISSKTGRRQGGPKGRPGSPRDNKPGNNFNRSRGPRQNGPRPPKQDGSRPPKQGGYNKHNHARPNSGNMSAPSNAPRQEPRTEAKDKPLYSKIQIED